MEKERVITEAAVQERAFTLRELALYFLKLGSTGFGGPIALVGYMNRDLVRERGWYREDEFVRGLAFSQLAPGPLATQLAIYLGFVRAGVWGATLVSFTFLFPSFLMVLGLGALYVEYGTQGWISSAFYGVGAAVIAVIVRSSVKLTRTTLERDWLLWSLAALSLGATLAMGGTQFLYFLAGGIIALVASYAPWRKGTLNLLVLPALLVQQAAENRSVLDILIYFLKSGMIVFGSGLAIVPFLHGGVVSEYHWLTERQFIDAVAVAMITPGPVVITVAFIGYLVHGFGGALAAAAGVFLPVYLFVIGLAPLFERVSHNVHVRAFVRGVTAVATGAIAGGVWLLARSAIVDLPSVLILVVSGVLLVRFKVAEPIIILGAGIAGLLIRGF